MARVEFLNAILSGKLGGTVYARNKGGYYVRSYAVPTNPKTVAQSAARSTFAGALTAWHSLTEAEKSAWNSFATTNFAAFSPVPNVTYSGFNAFVSVRAVALNGNRLARELTMSGADGELTITQSGFTAPLEAPDSEFSSLIKTSAGVALAVELIDGELDVSGVASFTLRLAEAQTVAPLFVDPVSGDGVGYALFASNALTQDMQFVQNPFLHLIGTAEPPVISSGWAAEEDDEIKFEFASEDLSVASRKLWFSAGDVAQLSVVAISQYGQLQHLNSVKVDVNG